MRIVFAALALAAGLAASTAHAEPEKGDWVLIENPEPGYQRFKTAVRVDTLRREGPKLQLEFLVVERGDTTPQGEQKVEYVFGEADCGDASHSDTFYRLTMAAGSAEVRKVGEESYPRGGGSAASLGSNEVSVARLFCGAVPKGIARVSADNGETAVMLLQWLKLEK